MLDRESTFTNQDLLGLLRERFIPVAIDQAYERRQKDAKGEFYRRIAGQSPRNDFQSSTQGFYVATAGGELLLYNNNRHPEKVARLVKTALDRFDAGAEAREAAAPIEDGQLEKRWNPKPPKGGLVLRAHTKVLGGYPEPENRWDRILQGAIGRDNLWLTAQEHEALLDGRAPESMFVRMVRYHFVDNTRGEPPMWRSNEVELLKVERTGPVITGVVRLRSGDGKRSYVASLRGLVAVEEGRLTGFDLVADGSYFGEGRYTPGAPKGRFPFAVSVTLADGKDIADGVPPQGGRGWMDGYLRARRSTGVRRSGARGTSRDHGVRDRGRVRDGGFRLSFARLQQTIVRD